MSNAESPYPLLGKINRAKTMLWTGVFIDQKFYNQSSSFFTDYDYNKGGIPPNREILENLTWKRPDLSPIQFGLKP